MPEEKPVEREIPKEFTQGYTKRTETPKTCPKCGSSNIKNMGGGIWRCLSCLNAWKE